MEIQATARAIRLGQDKDKDVEVFRYIIRDTVEGVSLLVLLLTGSSVANTTQQPIRDQQTSKKRLAGMGFVKPAVLGVEETA